MSFKEFRNPTEFKLEDVFSWGVEKGKFDMYSIPVTLSEEDASKISDLSKENGAKNPVYGGKTIYLKVKVLSNKQEEELLGKGKTNIQVYFKFTGVYTKNDVNYLTHKVSKLRKLGNPKVAEEDIPED